MLARLIRSAAMQPEAATSFVLKTTLDIHGMTHIGQCPRCHVSYELNEDDIGHLVTCECGALLFCGHITSTALIDVVCELCHEVYEIPGSDAGVAVECECGNCFTVPTILLRQPVHSNQGTATPNGGQAQTNKPTTNQAQTKQQPPAQTPPATKTKTNDKLPQPAGPLAIDTSEPTTNAEKNHSERLPAKSRNKDPLSLFGLAAVAILLIVALAMFARQHLFSPTSDKSKNLTTDPQTKTPSSPTTEATLPAAITNEDLQALSGGSTSEIAVPLIEVSLPETAPIIEESVQANNGSGSDSHGTTESANNFPTPPAPLYALPKPQTPRPRIPISTDPQPYMTLRSGVEDAFDAYEETMELLTIAEETKSDTDHAAYKQSMGRTLALLHHVHSLAAQANDTEQVNSMRYLLAYLSYSAGHLPEAIVMGQAVARWGTLDDPATKEAAMIALAAAQEASDTQWGSKDQVGELAMMQSVAEVIADRWPKDEQLDSIWMNLGYLYEAYNLPKRAVEIYGRLPAKSNQYADAQVASGMAVWRMARRQAINEATSIERTSLQQAQQMLKRGLRTAEKSESPLDERVIGVRLALAQIALLKNQPQDAKQLLTVNEKPIIDQIRLDDAPKKKGHIVVSEYTTKQLFDALYYTHLQLGDSAAANQTLEQLVATIDSVEIDLEARLVSTVKKAADRLKAKPAITSQDIDQFAELAQPIMDDEQHFPTENLLWLGETWGRISDQANDTTTSKRCAAEGATIYKLAMSRTDFPPASIQSAQLRRIELLRKSGNLAEAIQTIEKVLGKTPNIFSLQIAAAQSLQDLGVASGKVSDVQAAIDGPTGFSSIWGWGKLVSTLYTARWSASGTDTHATQLFLAQFNLAQCQMLVAKQTKDSVARRLQLTEIERSLQRILATMDDSNPWEAKFQQLSALVKNQR
ncbi:MAG: hypothetical protein P8L85_24140 [Rubripirellula sp.]|nr:hypothetical protein [Rubripirellula sp.]